jgi:hypothetical protein
VRVFGAAWGFALMTVKLMRSVPKYSSSMRVNAQATLLAPEV